MIDILLPVYNGEKYLLAQIDSVSNQSRTDWRLIIRDDGSTDNSRILLYDVKRGLGNKIHVIEDNRGNIGVNASIGVLLSYSSSDYIMICDQDDIWLPNKIEVEMDRMAQLEKNNSNIPILVCADSICIDESGHVIADSFFSFQKFMDVTDKPIKMAALNIVQGNTCLMNKICKKYILPIPSEGYYDYWIGVIISYYGKVHYEHKQLLYYRQHSGNVVGANQVDKIYFFHKCMRAYENWISYTNIFSLLPFKINMLKWLFYKIEFTLIRMYK